jgi:hypothetical protein
VSRFPSDAFERVHAADPNVDFFVAELVDSSGVSVSDLPLPGRRELARREVRANRKPSNPQALEQRGTDFVLDLQIRPLVPRNEPAGASTRHIQIRTRPPTSPAAATNRPPAERPFQSLPRHGH